MGVFNCQGAGWCKVGKTNLIHDLEPGTVTGVIRAKDVDFLPKVAHEKWTGDAVIYSHLGGEFSILIWYLCLPKILLVNIWSNSIKIECTSCIFYWYNVIFGVT